MWGNKIVKALIRQQLDLNPGSLSRVWRSIIVWKKYHEYLMSTHIDKFPADVCIMYTAIAITKTCTYIVCQSCRRGHRYHRLFKLDAQGELTEKTQRSTTTNTHPKKCSPIISDNELKCVCLNARSIVNKKSELDIMVADIDPHVIGITESWANEDIVDAELALTGYVMFRKDRRERRGGGVILYIKESIQAYEITLKSETDSVEAIHSYQELNINNRSSLS